MAEYIKTTDAITTTWMILRGMGYAAEDNPDMVKTVAAVFNTAPAADVVEVVRCQDCVHWRGENDICKGIGIDFSADGYCSEGKRKDGGQDNA